MRIQIASDLHLEHVQWRFPEYRAIEPCAADVLVLAGDINQGTRALDQFADWPYPVVYVPGNHEYYNSSLADIEARFVQRAEDYPNVSILAPGCCEIAGVRFIGCTLWTDYELFGKEHRDLAMAICGESIPDHTAIKVVEESPFTPAAALTLHLAQRQWLKSRLAEPFNGKTVVVTHHAPSALSLHPRFAKDITSAGFMSNLSELLGKAELHIHGHTHHSFDYMVNGTRVIANPKGYSKGVKWASIPADLAHENPSFDQRFTVEI